MATLKTNHIYLGSKSQVPIFNITFAISILQNSTLCDIVMVFIIHQGRPSRGSTLEQCLHCLHCTHACNSPVFRIRCRGHDHVLFLGSW